MQNLINTYLDKFKRERRMRRWLVCVLLLLALLVGTGVYWQLRLTGAALTNEVYCGKTEHVHDDSCYELVLVCGLEESEGTPGHTHTEECYETVTTLICGLEEGEDHTHTEACYQTEQVLICELEECEPETGHTHTDACYEKQLVCGLEEHTHTIACMIDETADLETASVWEATLPSTLSGTWAENLVAVAKSQVGYAESTANFKLADDGETTQGYTRYGAWAGNEYGDWDAMFVSFCLSYAGVPQTEFPEATGAYAWSVTLNNMGLYEDASDYEVQSGDLVFFDADNDGKIDRVGIVVTVNESNARLTVIEGDYAANEGDTDAVCSTEYSVSDQKIVGYGTVSAAQKSEEESETEEAETEAEESEITAAAEGLTEVETEKNLAEGESEENQAETESEEGLTEVESEEETDFDGESETESESEMEPESEGSEISLMSECEEYTVVVTYDEDAEIPEDAVLVVEEYDSDSELYQAAYAEAVVLYGWSVTGEVADAEETQVVAEYADAGETEAVAEVADEGEIEAIAETTDTEEMKSASETTDADVTEAEAEAAVADASTGLEFRLFSFELYADGEKIELTAQGSVTFTFHNREGAAFCTVTEYGVEDGEAAAADFSSEYNEESGDQILQFALNDGFYYAISSAIYEEDEETEEELTTLTYEGEDYVVTVTYGEAAGLPDNVELIVSEYAQDSENWQTSYAEAAALYGWDQEEDVEESASGEEDAENETEETEVVVTETEETDTSEPEDNYHGFRLFNIGLYVDGEEIEPDAAVTVTISYLGKDGLEYYSVTHFGEETTETMDVLSDYQNGSQTITFEATGFSEYGISLASISGDTTVQVGKSILLTSTSGNNNHNWTYTSTDGGEVSFDSTNNKSVTVTGVKVGTVTITHTWGNNNKNKETYTITVTAATPTAGIVLNLGNGNGVLQDSDYSGGSQGSGGTDLRYTVDLSNANEDTDRMVTIHLPSDSDLSSGTGTSTFTVVDADDTSNSTDITVDLANEAAPYAWKLVGWINIATGEYYDVSNGSVDAAVDLDDDNVFYADWIAESYDFGSSSTLGVDTSSFITIQMFDYNELFNLYSASLTQSGLTSETWADSGSLYSDLLIRGSSTVLDESFIFQNSRTNNSSDQSADSNGLLGFVKNLQTWNWNNEKTYDNWEMDEASTSPVFSKLYDTSGSTIGVEYLGTANYLFQIDSDGYYYFNSDEDGAAYNQSAQRFYLSDTPTTVSGYGQAFFPYNEVDSYSSISDGTLNYWFGMSIEIDFYLPNDVGTGGNIYNDTDMLFEFTGDDDVWVFIDGELVMNMSGIHSTMSGTIDFSSGDVTVNGTVSSKALSGTTAGTHTLTVYYMERGAWDSNLSIKLNMVPRWVYETAEAGTMKITKVWKDSDGNTVTGTDTSGYSSVTMGLFQKTTVTSGKDNGDGTVTYTWNNTDYILQSDGYSYDSDSNGYVNAYVSDGYLYVRVDTQVVSYSNDWTYTWELLDLDNTYEVLELTDLSNYTTTSTYSALQEYEYWKAVDGCDALNGTVTYDGSTYTRTGGILTDGLQIVLTDGAQNGNASTSGYPATYNGYVIDSDGSSISTKEAQFSQKATESVANSGSYTYGVTSDTYVSTTSVWTVELTGEYVKFGDGTGTYYVPSFYLKDSSGAYLAITGTTGNYSLTTVSDKSGATVFSYNQLGELNTEDNTGLRIIIKEDGSYALVAGRQTETDTRNVKIYVKETVTTEGKDYTITNKRLPIVTLQKVSSADTSTSLSGAAFVLYKTEVSGNETKKYYYSYNQTDGVSWVENENQLTTDASGSISFISLPDGTYYLEEVTAPDGYNTLNGTITFIVADGKVTSVSGNSAVMSLVKATDSLTIRVMNTPGYEMPESGGSGTWMFTLIGTLFVLFGGVGLVLLYGRRRMI
ncbi:MAG: hypothetical protein LUD12_00455 [Lachnospiraceae bacterium]|nr:hypothetical protein [Lachnospiraceae bacterium]